MHLWATRKYINRTVHCDIVVSSKSLISDLALKGEMKSSLNIQLSQNKVLGEMLSWYGKPVKSPIVYKIIHTTINMLCLDYKKAFYNIYLSGG